MPRGTKKTAKPEKQVTRYTYDDVKEPRTPETGHTALLPGDEQVVTLSMDNGWSHAIEVGKLPEEDDRPVVIDMDPAADPVLFWAGKRNKRKVPVLPLQRNEIVSESRISQIIQRTRKAAEETPATAQQGHLFANLEKTLRESDRTRRVEFYTHDEGWKNKLICGDSLHVMESLLRYEGIRGKVQMIFMDPPYGIAYDSNFQQRIDQATNDEDAGVEDVVTVRAFRDCWILGPHSYLSYLHERLYLCRELLTEAGSIFFQIGEDNVHMARVLMDEVFGRTNFVSQITFRKKLMPLGSKTLESMADFLLWYAKDRTQVKYHQLYVPSEPDPNARWTGVELPDGTRRSLTTEERKNTALVPKGGKIYSTVSQLAPSFSEKNVYDFEFEGVVYRPPSGQCWLTGRDQMAALATQNRLVVEGGDSALCHVSRRFSLQKADKSME